MRLLLVASCSSSTFTQYMPPEHTVAAVFRALLLADIHVFLRRALLKTVDGRIASSPGYQANLGLYFSICVDSLSRNWWKFIGFSICQCAHISPSAHSRYMSYAVTIASDSPWHIALCQYFRERKWIMTRAIKESMVSIRP